MPKMNNTTNTESKVTYMSFEDIAEGSYKLKSIYSKIMTSKNGNKYLAVTMYVIDDNDNTIGVNIPLNLAGAVEGVKRYCPNVKSVTISGEKYKEFTFV